METGVRFEIVRFLRLPLLLSLLTLGANCSSIVPSSEGSGATSSSGGSGSTYTPPTCDQGCQDYLVAWALDDTIWFLWNQKLAGHPSGPQDISGPCPLGGSVHVTGTDETVADGTTTTAVRFELTACEYSDRLFDLTFTGTVSMDGSFNGNSGATAEVFTAPGLQAKGSLDWLDDPAIDEGCDVTFSQQGSGDNSALSGKVCGRSFDEDSLQRASSGGTSQGGTGSSSAGTSSSNNCACLCPDGRDCTGAKTPNPCGLDADGIPEACGCPVGCN